MYILRWAYTMFLIGFLAGVRTCSVDESYGTVVKTRWANMHAKICLINYQNPESWLVLSVFIGIHRFRKLQYPMKIAMPVM